MKFCRGGLVFFCFLKPVKPQQPPDLAPSLLPWHGWPGNLISLSLSLSVWWSSDGTEPSRIVTLKDSCWVRVWTRVKMGKAEFFHVKKISNPILLSFGSKWITDLSITFLWCTKFNSLYNLNSWYWFNSHHHQESKILRPCKIGGPMNTFSVLINWNSTLSERKSNFQLCI